MFLFFRQVITESFSIYYNSYGKWSFYMTQRHEGDWRYNSKQT